MSNRRTATVPGPVWTREAEPDSLPRMSGTATGEAATSSSRTAAAATRDPDDGPFDPRRVGIERVIVARVASAIAAPLLVSLLHGLGAPSLVAIGISAPTGFEAETSREPSSQPVDQALKDNELREEPDDGSRRE